MLEWRESVGEARSERTVFELMTLGIFLLGLSICIIGGFDILYALVLGSFCFNFYSFRKGFSLREIAGMMAEGIIKVKKILMIFTLIGFLTACWRICGTIPFIIYYGVQFIEPQIVVLCIFLLCCAVSFLIGTSLGTMSTVGVISMMLSNSAGLDPLWSGGAILSGIYFGDRNSPLSSSAQLVSTLTGTDIYDNVKGMLRTGAVPFVLTSIIYLFSNWGIGNETVDKSSVEILATSFQLHWVTILPALLILVLAMLRVDVRIAMGISILSGIMIAIFLQKEAIFSLVEVLVFGYDAENNPELAKLLNGGGFLSMLRASLIVMISGSYFGVFLHTPLLTKIIEFIKKAAKTIGNFSTTGVTAIFTAAVCCSQTMAVIVTDQLCQGLYSDKKKFALVLENTAILLSAMIPWNTAVSVPLATLEIPPESILFASFLYIVPLWNGLTTLKTEKR